MANERDLLQVTRKQESNSTLKRRIAGLLFDYCKRSFVFDKFVVNRSNIVWDALGRLRVLKSSIKQVSLTFATAESHQRYIKMLSYFFDHLNQREVAPIVKRGLWYAMMDDCGGFGYQVSTYSPNPITLTPHLADVSDAM